VVAATGLGLHTSRPPQFANVPSSLASHSSELRYPANFAGRRVAVIGAGQSAMESAVLLGEAGAEVELIARCPRLRWLRAVDGSQGNPWLRGVIHRATSPPSELGPFPLNWVVELPDMFRLVPGSYQLTVANRTVRPAASGWLLPRTGGLRLTTGRNVVSATHQSSGLVLKLDDGSERTVDHAVLATGYRIDVARYSYLSPLAPEVRSIDGYPVLSRGLESSVPRLHFTGAAAARSFGPLMRFVWGTGYASRELTCHLVSDTRVVAGMVRDYAGAIER
jgi:hypothetical protein